MHTTGKKQIYNSLNTFKSQTIHGSKSNIKNPKSKIKTSNIKHRDKNIKIYKLGSSNF
jgi:hypothetical protein